MKRLWRFVQAAVKAAIDGETDKNGYPGSWREEETYSCETGLAPVV